MRFKGLVIAVVMLIGLPGSADQPFSADASFGAAMPDTGDVMTLQEAIARLDGQAESGFQKITGQVTEVCQAKGCWMILMEGDTYARITFEDYGFFIPTETSMQRTLVYGKLGQITLSGEQAAHYARDAGARDVVETTGEVTEYSIVARSVQLEESI
ncbi:MAG: DUF4920 domain-containing protein [Pseudohongiellaceae bacterium]